jgi:small subunit ribosomal protein S6
MRERQHDYELLFIISPVRSSEEDVAATIDRIRQAVTTIGGEITRVDHSAPWGRRKLAYPIRKYTEGEASRRAFTEGFYVLCHLRLPTTQITEFDRVLKLNDAVIRYLLTLVEQKGKTTPFSEAAPVVAAVGDDFDEDEDEIDDEEDLSDE